VSGSPSPYRGLDTPIPLKTPPKIWPLSALMGIISNSAQKTGPLLYSRRQSYKTSFGVKTLFFGINYATFLSTNLSLEINAKINAKKMSFVVIPTIQNRFIGLKKLFILIMPTPKFWRRLSFLIGLAPGPVFFFTEQQTA
jgi:hypothetical protein